MQKIWNVKKYDENEIIHIKEKWNISEILAKLLLSRDIRENEIEKFLKGTLDDLEDPFKMKDMEQLVNRIMLAIERKEKICIYGDYDVDGITSITIMYQFLTEIGASVEYYLPDRLLEGYGMNNQALEMMQQKGVSLVITVDCGITAVEEVEYAKQIGLDVCITDHHECSDHLPDAIAIVNPKQKEDQYPFKMHAGVGVAFKCLAALSEKLHLEKESYLKYLDIVAIGTISDIVPLVDENRIISKFGLKEIEKTQNVGLKALLKITNFKEIDSQMVSFGLAPRMNACGRMGNASVAVELLLEQNEAVAFELAKKLDMLNNERQLVEKKIFEDAIDMIEKNGLDKKNSIVLYQENWHNGVIGIVASRLVNIYYKPVILFTKEHGMIRGSGRCQIGFSLYDALTACKEYLIQFGGHELAAGMSIDETKINEFIQVFEEAVVCQGAHLNEQIIEVDTEIKSEDLNKDTLNAIKLLKPYGQANKVPLFLYRNLRIKSIRTLKEDKHLKFTFQDGKYLIEAVAFSQGDRRDELKVGDKLNVICHVEVNSYNLPKTIQLIVEDFQKTVE